MLGLGIGLHKNRFSSGIDPIQALIDAFKIRVASEGGVFQAEACLYATLTELNSIV